MNTQLVSVVVPTRNRARLLERCLAALVSQTYQPLEIVLVDDCSTDDTSEVIARFQQNHKNVSFTVLRNDPQRGANPSRNRAIAASRGSLVAFEDDDCIAEPEWIENLVAGFVSERVGAVTGIVEDQEPRNIYDLAFRGTHRVYGKVHATRLAGTNMCVRRELLEGMLDEDRAEIRSDTRVSGRGDEESLYLKLKSRGYEVRIAHNAKVLHEHYYSFNTFFRQAFAGGGATARLGYKYGLPFRIELVCLVGGYAFFILSFIFPPALLLSLGCFGVFAAGALFYNEIWRKKKTLWQAIRIAPVMTAYYHVRTYGYAKQYLRLWLGVDRLVKERL
jgi:glycosyltransferase involved in cell wall biosynthesis